MKTVTSAAVKANVSTHDPWKRVYGGNRSFYYRTMNSNSYAPGYHVNVELTRLFGRRVINRAAEAAASTERSTVHLATNLGYHTRPVSATRNRILPQRRFDGATSPFTFRPHKVVRTEEDNSVAVHQEGWSSWYPGSAQLLYSGLVPRTNVRDPTDALQVSTTAERTGSRATEAGRRLALRYQRKRAEYSRDRCEHRYLLVSGTPLRSTVSLRSGPHADTREPTFLSERSLSRRDVCHRHGHTQSRRPRTTRPHAAKVGQRLSLSPRASRLLSLAFPAAPPPPPPPSSSSPPISETETLHSIFIFTLSLPTAKCVLCFLQVQSCRSRIPVQ